MTRQLQEEKKKNANKAEKQKEEKMDAEQTADTPGRNPKSQVAKKDLSANKRPRSAETSEDESAIGNPGPSVQQPRSGPLMPTPQKKKTTTSPTTASQSYQTQSTPQPGPSATTTTTTKPPTIIVEETPQQVTYRILKENAGLNNFIIKRVNNKKHHMLLQTITDLTKTIEILKKQQIKYYTYTPKTQKPYNLVIKGLDNSFNTDEILADLQTKKPKNATIIKIATLQTAKAKRENRTPPFFPVQLSPDSDVNAFTQIRYLMHQVVTWERLIKREPTTCVRCQKDGHTARNCNLEYKCVKCPEKHEPGHCKILKGSKIYPALLFCVKCKNTATRRRTGVARNTKKKKNKQRSRDIKNKKAEMNTKKLNMARAKIENSTVRPNTTYANAAKANTKNTPATPSHHTTQP